MKTILGMINEFVDKELIPLEPEFVTTEFRDMLPVLEEKRRMVRQMELWGPNHPKDLGGMGLTMVEHGLVSEALGRTPLGHYVFGCQAPDAGNIEILHLHGTTEQKEQYLKPLAAGKIRSCFSMTEVDMPGSNPVMLETTAVKDGNDYVINGHKWYTTAADGSKFAIVMAVTNPEAPTYLQASMIIVPTDTPGFNLVRNIPVMGHSGSDYASHGEILLPELPRAAEEPPGHRKGTASSSRRSGSDRDGFITACGGSASASGRLTCMCNRANARDDRAGRQDPGDAADRAELGGGIGGGDTGGAAADPVRGMAHRHGRREGGAGRCRHHQMGGGQHHEPCRGPGAPGARRPRHDGRHDPGLFLPARAGGAHL